MGTSKTSFEKLTSKLLSRPATSIPLAPKKAWDPSISREIDDLTYGTDRRGKGNADVLKAVLHLLNDDIHNAHELAQAHEESMTANYTHAILHRREQDYWNSKWWLSRVSHPVIKDIHNGTSGAKRFVDEVEQEESAGSSAGASSSKRESLQAKQLEELKALLEYAMKEMSGS